MVIFFNELEHGFRVSTLGSKGQPMPDISRATNAFCDSGNCCWISVNIVTWLLEEGRIVKSLRQVEKCILMAQPTSLPQMVSVLFSLGKTRRMCFGPLLFHPRQDAPLLPLFVPIGTSSVRVLPERLPRQLEA